MVAFTGKNVIAVEGDSAADIKRMEQEVRIDIKTWGKHLLLCFTGFTCGVHLLLFGSDLVNEDKKTPLRLGLRFENEHLIFTVLLLKFWKVI